MLPGGARNRLERRNMPGHASEREPRHARDDGAGRDALAAQVHSHRTIAVDDHPRREAAAYGMTVLLEITASWLGKQVIERAPREADRGIARAAAEHPRDNLDEGRRRRHRGRLVQRRHRERFPQDLVKARRLPVRGQPLVNGAANLDARAKARAYVRGIGTRAITYVGPSFSLGITDVGPSFSSGVGLPFAVQAPEHPAKPQGSQPIAHAERRPSQQSNDQMKGRRQRRRVKAGTPSRAVEDFEIQRRVEDHAVGGADRAEEGKRLVITAEENVLAVIHHFS